MNRTYSLPSPWCVAVALALLGYSSADAQQTSYSCANASDVDANALRSYIVALVTAPPNSRNASARNAYQLPAMSAGDVSIEIGPPVCRDAGAAYHQVLYGGAPEIDRDLILIEVGATRYVVLDRQESMGEFEIIMVFDNSWQHLASFTG